MSRKNGKAPEKVALPPIPIPEQLKGSIARKLDDPEALEAFPNLMELILPKYVDGRQVTQEGTLRIAIRGGRWAITLDLPTFVVSGTVMPLSLTSALADLERTISQGSVIWLPGFRKQKKKILTIEDS